MPSRPSSEISSFSAQTLGQSARHGLHARAGIGVGADEAQRGQGGAGDGGGGGGGEHKGAGGVEQPVGHLPVTADEAALRAEGLAEGAHGDGDAGLQAELRGHPCAVGPPHAGGMGFVDHQIGAGFRRGGGDVRERRDVPVHAEDGFGDDEFTGVRTGGGELGAQVFDIVVAESPEARARQPAAVEQAGVREAVGKDVASRVEQCRDNSGGGHHAAAEQAGGGIAFEPGDGLFEFDMKGAGAGDESGGAGAGAEVEGGPGCGFAQFRTAGETEVVVGGEIQEGTAGRVRPAIGGLRQDLIRPQQAALAPILQLVTDPGIGGAHWVSPIDRWGDLGRTVKDIVIRICVAFLVIGRWIAPFRFHPGDKEQS